jgi:hypothetical protein
MAEALVNKDLGSGSNPPEPAVASLSESVISLSDDFGKQKCDEHCSYDN